MGLQELILLRVARRWIAGVDLDTAMKDAKAANIKGIGVVVNFLGEEIKDPSEADANATEYLKLQQSLFDGKINGFASVKLTQLGLGADDSGMATRLEKIAVNSSQLNQLLWVDMEGSAFVDRTLSTYLSFHEKYNNMGLALQSYTRRSEADLKKILDAGGTVRLVKGAYRESPDFVYPTRDEVSKNFTKLMEMLFDRGQGFAIATHDTALLDKARSLSESKHADFRFELLKGIRDDVKEDLVKSGFKVSEYLPYGDRWWAYSKRRVTEHPSNIWLLLRSLV